MLQPIGFPAGVRRGGTERQSSGRWFDSDLIRWLDQDIIAPIGGWGNRQHLVAGVLTNSVVSGSARGIYSWKRNDYSKHIAIGTHSKLYWLYENDAPVDITPAGYSVGSPGTLSGGYGYGLYGAGLYGTPRVVGSSFLPIEPTIWVMDNWGQELIACAQSDGKVYKFAPGDSVAQLIAAAPISNAGVLVTDERYMMTFGAGGNPRKIQWSELEDYTNWTPGVVSRAGSIELQTSGSIYTANKCRTGILFVTDKDAHIASYVGRPYIYGRTRVGSNCGAISRKSSISYNNNVAWMGNRGFWKFDGSVSAIPCEVNDFVFNNLNTQTAARIWGMSNEIYKEITWYYPDKTSNEPNRYVTWNWELNIWTVGALTRTCGISASIFNNPFMVDEAGNIYKHEYLLSHSGRSPYLEGGPVEYVDSQTGSRGDYTIKCKRAVHDFQPSGNGKLYFKTRMYPQGTQKVLGPYSLSSPKGVRFNSRQVDILITGDDNIDWRYGGLRLDIEQGPRR